MSQNKVNKTINSVKKTTKKAVDKTGNFVRNNPKTSANIAIGTGVVIVGYFAYRLIKNRIDPDITDTIDNVGSLPDPNTSNYSITDQEAINYASQLLEAFNKNRNSLILGGTDNDAVEQVFDKLQSGDDFLLVYNKFGKPEYNGFNSPVEGWEWLDSSFVKRDLVYWLKSEVGSFWTPTLFNKIKQRVESAGFVF